MWEFCLLKDWMGKDIVPNHTAMQLQQNKMNPSWEGWCKNKHHRNHIINSWCNYLKMQLPKDQQYDIKVHIKK